MIACEPEPFLDIGRRCEETGAFRKADITDEIGGFTGAKMRHRAILLRPVLHRVLHEAGIDRDNLAAWQPRRDKSPGAGSGNIVANGRTGAVDHYIWTSAKSRPEMDAAKFICLGVERTPCRCGRQRDRRSREPFSQRRDQRMLFYPPLELPDAETNEGSHHNKREKAKAEARPSRCRGHFGSRSINGGRSRRPGAAL